MMGFYLNIILVLAVTDTTVVGLSTGAPPGACVDIFPVGHTNPANTATGQAPFNVNTSSLDDGYTPGQTYTIILTGSTTDANFRGFLIQGRMMADGTTPAGEFMDNGTDQELVCDGDTAVTHSDNTEKTMVTLSWTAPAMGTGTIQFRYAFVDRYIPTSTNMFWANQVTAAVNEVTVEPTTAATVAATTATIKATAATAATTDIDNTSDASSPTMPMTMSMTTSPTPTGNGGGGGAKGVMASTVLILLFTCIITLIN